MCNIAANSSVSNNLLISPFHLLRAIKMKKTSRQSISESLTKRSAALGEVMAQLDNADVCVTPQLMRSHTL